MMKRKVRKLKKKGTPPPSRIRVDDEVEICVKKPVSIKIEEVTESDSEDHAMQPYMSGEGTSCCSTAPFDDAGYETQKDSYPCSSHATDEMHVSSHTEELKASKSTFEDAGMTYDSNIVAEKANKDFSCKLELIENPDYSYVDDNQCNLSDSSLNHKENNEAAIKMLQNISDDSMAKNIKKEIIESSNMNSNSCVPFTSSDKVDEVHEELCLEVKSEPDVTPSTSKKNNNKVKSQKPDKRLLRGNSQQSQEMHSSKRGTREIDQLYKSLQEISWANDKSFMNLLYSKGSLRHSERLSVTKGSQSNSCAKSKQESDANKLATSSNVSNNSNSAQKSCDKVGKGKQACTKKNIKQNAEATQSKVLPTLKVQKPALRANLKTQSKQIDQEKPEKKKADEKPRVISTKRPKKATTYSRKKCGGKGSKMKPGEPSVKIKVEKDVSESEAKKCKLQTTKNASNVSRSNATAGHSKQPIDFQSLIQNPSPISTTEPKDLELLAHGTLQERMLRVFSAVDQRHISPVLRETHDSRSSKSSKNPRKRKYEEEAVRSSVRQSECAFRYKEIVVKKHTHYMQVVLVPNISKQNCLTIGAMKELKEALQSARRDPNCKAILLNSSGSFFCSGIDMRHLCGSAKKHSAEEMAIMIRDLILTFAIFPKPVVAAVNGCAIGLGVALLTYCDIVLASDKATFSIPATRFGYIPEGGVTLTLPQVVGSTVAMEMLLHGRNLTAEQAMKCGLVSEVLWPTKLMEEVVPRIQRLVQQPLQAMEVTKTMVRCHLWEKLAVVLNNEWHILTRQWASNQCQQKMKQHIKNGWTVY